VRVVGLLTLARDTNLLNDLNVLSTSVPPNCSSYVSKPWFSRKSLMSVAAPMIAPVA
jgi:hypothetical protein